MEFQSAIDFLSGTKKPKSEGSFDSALQFLEGLSAPPVAPLTPQQAQAQFAQIPYQAGSAPPIQAPQAPQGNVVQRAIAPAASFLDVTLGGVAPGIIAPVTYAGSRAFGATPEQATASSQASAAPFVDPFGKMLGVSELPQYKGEATRQIMDFVGANMGKGAAWISQQTGYPAADIENMMQTLTAGGGVAASRALSGRMGVSPAVSQVQDQFKQAQAARGRVEPVMTPEMAGAVTPETPVAAAAMPEVPMAVPEGQLVVSKAPGIEVSYIKPTPVAPPNTPFITSPLQERIAPTSTTTPRPTIDNPFVEPMYAKTGKLPVEEQLYRVETIKELGVPTIREGTRTGDGFQTANEYVTAKTSGPNKDLFNQQIATEQQALRNYANGIVEKTGGSVGLDENALYNRGQAIAQPFDDFKDLLKQQINDSYKAANELAQGQPIVQTEALQKLLKTNSEFVRLDEIKALRNGIREYVKELGLQNKDGSIKPMTVEQLERLKEYINTGWDFKTSNIIAKIKNAIDDDVSKVAGEDIYKSSRALRIKLANLLENPTGVSKVMDYDPNQPINRVTPFPKIPDVVEKMTPDQQAHLIKVLQDMPPELQPQAQKAIAEIKSQFANQIAEIGGKGEFWDAPAVSKYLKANNLRLRVLTGDPEMARALTVLNDGGHFLRMDNGYKGAAIQFKNMYDNPLISGTAQSLGSAVGGGLGYVTGAAFGPTVAGASAMTGAGLGKVGAQRFMQSKSAARAARKGQESLQPIQDVLKRLERK
jgi:hypothetical protein